MSGARKPLRRNVCAVLTDADERRVLVFRRVEWRALGKPWQFPQGGLEADETPEAGLLRELREEIGANRIEVLRRLHEPVVYEWPPDLVASLPQDTPMLNKYRGQAQHWFLARLLDGTDAIHFRNQPAEFDAYEWVTPAEALARVVAFKTEAYRAGLSALGLLPAP